MDPQSRNNEKFFATRGKGTKRKILNLIEIQRIFPLRDDIVRIYLNIFPKRANKEIASKASIIAGPHGANLTNALFSPKNTTLLEIIPKVWTYRQRFNHLTFVTRKYRLSQD